MSDQEALAASLSALVELLLDAMLEAAEASGEGEWVGGLLPLVYE